MARVKVKRKWVVRKCSNCGVPGHQKRTCKNLKAWKLSVGNVEVLKGERSTKMKPPANGHSKSIEYLKYRASTLGDQLRAINLAIAELDAAGE